MHCFPPPAMTGCGRDYEAKEDVGGGNWKKRTVSGGGAMNDSYWAVGCRNRAATQARRLSQGVCCSASAWAHCIRQTVSTAATIRPEENAGTAACVESNASIAAKTSRTAARAI